MSLANRIEGLRACGAAVFDVVDFTFIERLHAQSEQLPNAARRKTHERLRRHVFDLEMRFAAARQQVLREIFLLRRTAPDSAMEAERCLAGGDVNAARKVVERASRRLSSSNWLRAEDRLLRVIAAVEMRLQPAPALVGEARALLEHPDAVEHATKQAHRLANLLTLILLQEGAERVLAQLEVERLRREVPLEAGPYNPEALSAQLLDELGALSPTYLRVLLGYVSNLESMMRLPPSSSEAKKPEKASRRGKRR